VAILKNQLEILIKISRIGPTLNKMGGQRPCKINIVLMGRCRNLLGILLLDCTSDTLKKFQNMFNAVVLLDIYHNPRIFRFTIYMKTVPLKISLTRRCCCFPLFIHFLPPRPPPSLADYFHSFYAGGNLFPLLSRTGS
jgi:hypothetical protein